MSGRDPLAAQLRAMEEKSRRTRKAARRHLKEGEPDFASSKAYYAAFH